MSKNPQKPKNDLAQDLEELTTVLQRTQADFENYRRRSDEQRSEIFDFAKIEVVKEILPILDDIERALGHLPKELEKNDWAKGVVSVSKRAQAALNKMGVERIKTVGEAFDPHLHEAVSAEGEGENEIISTELQAGYQIDGEVIRPAIVKVTRET